MNLLELIGRIIHIGHYGPARIRLREPVPHRIVRIAFIGAPTDLHLRQAAQTKGTGTLLPGVRPLFESALVLKVNADYDDT